MGGVGGTVGTRVGEIVGCTVGTRVGEIVGMGVVGAGVGGARKSTSKHALLTSATQSPPPLNNVTSKRHVPLPLSPRNAVEMDAGKEVR